MQAVCKLTQWQAQGTQCPHDMEARAPCASSCDVLASLQGNRLTATEQLGALTSLRKLHLDANCITVLDSLERLTNLDELHVCRQRLQPGQQLQFNPGTLQALAPRLRTLACSSRGLTSLASLAVLNALESVDAADNCLQDGGDVVAAVQQWPRLRSLDVRCPGLLATKSRYEDEVSTQLAAPSYGCQLPPNCLTYPTVLHAPAGALQVWISQQLWCCTHHNQCVQIIVIADHLGQLNGKPVRAQTREFLLQLTIKKLKHQPHASDADAGSTDDATSLHAGRHTQTGRAHGSKVDLTKQNPMNNAGFGRFPPQPTFTKRAAASPGADKVKQTDDLQEDQLCISGLSRQQGAVSALSSANGVGIKHMDSASRVT